MRPEQIAAVRDVATAITQPLLEELLQDLCRRVAQAGQLTSQAEYDLFQAKLLGLADQAIAQALQRQTALSAQKIEELLTYAAQNAAMIEDAGSLDEKIKAYSEITTKETQDLLGDLRIHAPDGQLLPLRDVYQRSTEYAFRQVFTGTKDYQTAIRNATRKMASAGIRTVESAKGRTYTIEYATRSAVLGRMSDMVLEMTQDNHDTLGCDGWEVSAHSGCAEDHEDIQGKQYSDQAYERMNSRQARRIGTLHCKHFATPIVIGANEPQYTQEQLEQLKRENADGVTYQGKHYTLYEAGQTQAALESKINQVQHRCLADEALQDTTQLQTDQIMLGRLHDEYKRFSKAAGLPLRRERLRSAGWGHSEASKASAAYARDTNGAASEYQLLDLTHGQGNANIRRLAEENRLTDAHKALMRKSVQVVIASNTAKNSSFNHKTRTLTLRNRLDVGEYTHEVGHAISAHKSVYKDKKFLDILKDSVGEYNQDDIFTSVITQTGKPLDLLNCSTQRFVSDYQRRIYRIDEFGNQRQNSDNTLNLLAMREFFSEAFRVYYYEPDYLKRVNPDLYQYIEELSE